MIKIYINIYYEIIFCRFVYFVRVYNLRQYSAISVLAYCLVRFFFLFAKIVIGKSFNAFA